MLIPRETPQCVRPFKPKIVYHSHQGESDPDDFSECLKDTGIEVRFWIIPECTLCLRGCERYRNR